MLKIKDNVDLKELEKFGFDFDFIGHVYTKNIDDKKTNKEICDDEEDIEYKDFVFLNIYYEDNREISLYFQDMEDYYSVKLDTLYDLIKADLVEKVKE